MNKYYIFMIVYKNQNFSKSAHELFTTQPSISYAIKELESALNVKLFYRVHNGVIPTAEADELYQYLLEAFQVIRFGEEKIKKMSILGVGTIKIGVPSHIGVFYLDHKMQKFNKLYPNIKFEIICKSVSELSKMLETHHLDLVIESRKLTTTKEELTLRSQKLLYLHYCFIFHKDFFIKYNNLEEFLVEVSDNKLIVPNMGAPIWKSLNEIFTNVHKKMNPKFEVWTSEMVLDLVLRKMGVGYFVKEFIPKKEQDYLVIIEDDGFPSCTLNVSYIPKFQSVSSQKFINFLQGDEESG